MIDELLSLRMVMVSKAGQQHELFQEAVSSAPVPIELVAADSTTDIRQCLTAGADLMYVGDGLAPAEIGQVVASAQAVRESPFTILLTAEDNGIHGFATDAVAARPTELSDAKALIERSSRIRLRSRVLVVDDSGTMRSIVRKLLAGLRFPLDVSEAGEGFAALKTVRETDFDLVFLDYNMPGFSGLETLAELRREKRRVYVVLMTSMTDGSLAERAHELGAAFLKKPFYPADIEAVLCRFYGLRALNPNRA